MTPALDHRSAARILDLADPTDASSGPRKAQAMGATVLLFAISAIAAHATVAGGSPTAALGADSFSARVGRAHAAATRESSHMNRLMAVAASGAIAMGSSAFAQDAVRCWGGGVIDTGAYPNYGQSIVPSKIGTVAAIAAGGYHTAALLSDGTVRCWGRNTEGQSTTPRALRDVVGLWAGHTFNVALRSDGSIACWGLNQFGECTPPANLTAVSLVATGYWHALALQTDGVLRAWGANSAGQATVPTLNGVPVQLAAGRLHNTIRMQDGSLQAWGSNNYGQAAVPAGIGQVSFVTCGNYHTLAILPTRTVRAWGDNSSGQSTVPTGLDNVVAVGGGEYHSVALCEDGSIVCWGSNVAFINGYPSNQCVVPSDIGRARALAVGGYHAAVLTTACFGDTNLDSSVDGIDLATVLTRWAQPAVIFPEADCNRDGVIDGADLAIVLSSWGTCP